MDSFKIFILIPLYFCFSGVTLADCGHDLRKAAASADKSRVISILEKHPECVDNPYHNDKYTALIHAVLRNRLEIAEILLKAGANPNSATIYMIKPIHFAAYFGLQEMITLLIK